MGLKPGFLTKINLIEILLSIVLITVTTGMLLWNWDGFWQTEIPALKNTQQTYFPVKYKAEQDKLANINVNTKTQDLGTLLDRITELERENTSLKVELEQAKRALTTPTPATPETDNPQAATEDSTAEPETENPESIKEESGAPEGQLVQ